MPLRADNLSPDRDTALTPGKASNPLFNPGCRCPRSRFRTRGLALFASILLCFTSSCSPPTTFDPSSLTFLIEANPGNLDPRFATDGQSQRIDGLLFSGLLARDAQMNLHGDLAASWQTPDPLTYVFHLKPNIKFHDGHPVTSTDVKSTFDFILNPANKS